MLFLLPTGLFEKRHGLDVRQTTCLFDGNNGIFKRDISKSDEML
jgi:hypothetical protein